MQRNVIIAGPSAIFGLNAKDRGVGKEKNTKGTVTWVVFITFFMALSKTLKLWDKVCFQFQMSDSALRLNSHGKGIMWVMTGLEIANCNDNTS